MNKTIREILELLTKAEREFIEHHFNDYLDMGVSIGTNWLENENKDTMDLFIDDNFSGANIQSATVATTGWFWVEFDDEDYHLGEFEND